jgi:hypothetical protein
MARTTLLPIAAEFVERCCVAVQMGMLCRDKRADEVQLSGGDLGEVFPAAVAFVQHQRQAAHIVCQRATVRTDPLQERRHRACGGLAEWLVY